MVALQVKGLVVPLQGSNGDGAEVAFSTARLPPGNIQAVLRSTVMVADLKSSEGRKLSLAYQVWDGAWHSQVQVAGAQVIPVIEYISNRCPPFPLLPSLQIQCHYPAHGSSR